MKKIGYIVTAVGILTLMAMIVADAINSAIVMRDTVQTFKTEVNND